MNDEFLNDVPEDDGSGRRKRDPSPAAVQIRRARSSSAYKQAVDRFRDRCAAQRNADGVKGARCALCGNTINYRIRGSHPDAFSVDHIVPASERPDLILVQTNWQPAHLGCNQSKGVDGDVLAPGALGVASEIF